MDRRVAFVTGASRGIGKACAVHLARSGFDVAVTARTVRDGEARERSSTVQRSDTRPLPGSLSSTADEVRAAGRAALVVPADLLDRASLGAAVATERMVQDMGEFGFDAAAGAPPDVIGAVVAWLATTPEAAEWAGRVVPGQQLCHDRGLLPGWSGPVPNPV